MKFFPSYIQFVWRDGVGLEIALELDIGSLSLFFSLCGFTEFVLITTVIRLP